MLDIIITVMMIIASGLLGSFLHLNNAVIEALINLIPLFILSLRLWFNMPRNYFHVIGVINRNIQYLMVIRLEDTVINVDYYDKLCDNLRNYTNSGSGKLIKNSKGQYKWSSYIEVDACLIEIEYDLESENLYIETKSKTKFRNFLCDVENISEKLLSMFSESTNRYSNELINIKIEYLNRKNSHKENPFFTKFFDKFKDMNMDLRYRSSNGSIFKINNKGINVSSESLLNIKNDIKKEMLLF